MRTILIKQNGSLRYKAIIFLACIFSLASASAQFSISGDFTVTVNDTETYLLNGPSRTNVIWNVTKGTIQSSSNSSVTILWTSTGSGSIGAQVFYSGNSTFTGAGVTISNPGPPTLLAGSISGAQSICYSGDPSTLSSTSSASGGTGSYSYQWQYSNNGSSGWTNISNANSTSYNPPSGLQTTRWYRRRVVSGTQTKYTNTVQVSVGPTLIPGSISGGGTICNGGDPSTINNGSLALGGNGTYAYQWQSSTNGSSGWSNISGATSTSYNPPPLTSTRYYRRRVISCVETKYSNTVQITVNPALSPGSINGAQAICNGDDPSTLGNTSSASGGNGSYAYQWQSSSNGSSGWSNISGATSTTYNPPPITSTRYYRRRAISCGETKYTNTVQVTVSPALNAGSINGAQSVCYGEDPGTLGNASSASGGNGSYVYQWQSSSNGTSGWSNISGATSTSYNPPVLTSTRYYRRRAISCGETKYTNTIQITVGPTLIPGSISGGETVCYGGDPLTINNGTLAGGGDGSYAYQWQFSPNGSSGWSNINGAASSSYNPPPGITSDTWYRRRVISCGETKYSNTVQITVNPALSPGSINGAQAICNGEDPSALGNTLSASGGDGSYAYQWQSSSNGTSGWSNISGATSTSYNPPAITSTQYYRRRAISCGETKYTNTVQITVSPALNAGSISGDGQFICYAGDPANLGNVSSASGGDGNYAYQWQSSPNGTNSWSNITGATSTSYNPPSGLQTTRYYRRRAISCAQTQYTNTVQVSVGPTLIPGSISGGGTVCIGGDPSTINNGSLPSGGDGSYTYQWQSSPNGSSSWVDIGGATSSFYNPPSGIGADTWYRRSVISCEETKYSNAVQYSLYPELVPGSIDGAQSVCNGDNPSVLGNVSSASGGDGSYTYQWQSSPNGSNSWSDISGATSLTYDPPSNITADIWYRREAVSCGETEYSNIIAISVLEDLGVPTGSTTFSHCGGGTVALILTPATNADEVRWYTNANGGTLLATGTYDAPAVDATYYAASYNSTVGCESETRLMVIVESNTTTWYLDADGDNHAVPGSAVQSCSAPSPDHTSDPIPDDDCDDNDSNIGPPVTWYLDADGDGYPVEGSLVTQCENPGDGTGNPEDYSFGLFSGFDCDDGNPTIFSKVWYQDSDNDNLGDPNVFVEQCTEPTTNGPWVENSSDLCPKIQDPDNLCGANQGNLVPKTGSNYRYTKSYQTEVSASADFFLANNDIIQNITYYDDIGRPLQQINIDHSPGFSDIITPMQYDGYGRMEKEWLPYPATDGALATLRSGTITAIEGFYNTPKYENTANPYSQKEFEDSPLNRVYKQAAPGNDWALGQGHEIEFGYETNISSDNVRLFDVSITFADNTYTPQLEENGDYADGELYKIITRDENHSGTTKNHTTEEFTDKQGRVVLKRTYADTYGQAEVPHETYYVYDDFGNLTFVLPPKVDVTDGVSPVELSELCYQYVYDHRNRLIEKKIPGKGKEYIVYNKLDQPIMTQDANLRGNGEWLFTKYDAFGRVAYTGKAIEMEAGNPRSRIEVQADVDAIADDESMDYWVERGSFTDGNIDIGYENGAYPTTTLTEVLIVNYYDDYNFDRASEPSAPADIFGEPLDGRTKGLPTGGKVRVLGSMPAAWITTVTRYDDKARPIYTYSENEYLGTVDLVTSKLDFVGRPLKVRSEHTRGTTTVVTLDNFTYDHVGRLLTQTQCAGDATLGDTCPASGGSGNTVQADLPLSGNITSDHIATKSITVSGPATISGTVTLQIDPNATGGGTGTGTELIVFNDYDELGQLQAEKVGGAPENTYAATTGLQTVDYTYNVRGWLTGINDNNDTDNTLTPEANDLFAFRIGYNEGTNALYNGNIALTQWQTLNDDSSLKRYDYTYDALNRIKTGIDNTAKFNLANIDYDKNGNITALTRMGYVTTTPVLNDADDTDYDQMDVLDYAYHNSEVSNRLFKVRDDGNDTYGFKDGTGDTQDYWYDANGNMLRDLNKGIGSASTDGITYNHLNLPTSININGEIITYIYDATGTKLKKTVGSSVTLYAGNHVYSGSVGNEQLQFFNHPEGYVTPDGSGGYDYVYQYKDHLGNVRLSYQDIDNDGSVDSSEILQERNYYPFGLEHRGYNGSVQGVENNFMTYQGQELHKDLGLNWLSFRYRSYDPAIGRFIQADPLSGDFPYQSHYNFAENRVISGLDLEGLEYLDANVARIKVMRGEVRLKTSNMTWTTQSRIRSMNNDPRYWTRPGYIGVDTRVSSLTLSSMQNESQKAVPLATRNGVPVSSSEIGKTRTKHENVPIAQSTGKPDRRFKGRSLGGVSVKAKGATGAIALYNLAVTGFDYLSIYNLEKDKSLTKDQTNNVLPLALADMNSALSEGLIPEEFINESDLSDILNVVLQGVIDEPSADRNSIQYWEKMSVGLEIYNRYNKIEDEQKN
ncbi:MAG: hypothetical protein CMH48_09945 [Muricauda sp.]|nr:DUF6443 domain-containing protein [Allomuricauda sp.]MBC31156.1 hypothetical protein [Allomuricauda sp.]